MRETDTLPGSQQLRSAPTAITSIDRLRSVFRRWGYAESQFEHLQPAGRLDPDASLFRCVRAEVGGETFVLRPDFTSLVAREAATSERNAPRPLRRCYAGAVFRRPERPDDRRRELLQAGAELIGAGSRPADAEMVSLAADGLSTLGIQDAQIHIGHVGFVRGILHSAGLPESAEKSICDLLARHERANLETNLARCSVSCKAADALVGLLDLCGDAGVIERARALTDVAEAHRALDELSELASLLDERLAGIGPDIVFDLAEVRDRSYYTGLRFEAFAPGLGYPILRGGRYDHLIGAFGPEEPAIGCAFEVDRIAFLPTESPESPRRVLLRFSPDRWNDANREAKRLRDTGCIVVFDPWELDDDRIDEYLTFHRFDETLELSERDATRTGGEPR